MSIWKTPISLETIAERSQGTLASHLDIQFTEIGDQSLTATMPVDDRTRQPIGILNGGASCALIETLASTAANYAVDRSQAYCVGLSLDANHLKAVRNGRVSAVATPAHLGKTTQVWLVEISNEAGQKTCVGRMTMMVRQR